MKQVGIWIDKREAKIISIDEGNESFTSIQSEIEEFNPKGGSGTKLKGGPQDVIDENKYIEREKHQQKRFFKNVAAKLEDSDQIVIFGPAEMGKKLYSEFSASNPKVYEKVKDVQSADSMTDNQVKALVKDFYKIA